MSTLCLHSLHLVIEFKSLTKSKSSLLEAIVKLEVE